MHINWGRWAKALCATVVVLGLVACDNDAPQGGATIGAAGGNLDGPGGTRLVVPAGALESDITFRIARDATGAPPLDGLNPVSPIYAVTPHGQILNESALFSIPTSRTTTPPGTMLLKAEPDGKWRVMNDTGRVADAISTDLSELSFFVLATCQRTGETSGWIIGAVDCPTANSLKLELLDSNGTPIVVTPTGVNTIPPHVRVTGPTTLNFRLAWTRAPGTTRTDHVAVVGSGGFRSGFSSTWGAISPPGGVQETNTDLVRYFSVTIDPAQIGGAGRPGGTLRRVEASASYSATAFQVGRGNVGVGFEFSTHIPISVVYTGTQPTITQQPLPANVAVVENNSFTLAAAANAPGLSYEWRYLQNTNDSAGQAAEGVNNRASYTSPAVPLGWNGRLYYVRICSTDLGHIVCIDSQVSPLTVTPFAQPVAFTTQPVNRDILEGEGTNFGATVTGAPTPALRWHYNVTCTIGFLGILNCGGTPFNDGAGSGPFAGATISGATTATLNLAAVPLTAHGATVALAATQPGILNATWSSNAVLAVRARPAAAGFTQQLASPRTVQENGSIDFTVAVSGTRPINYTWSINATVITSGAITSGACAGARASFPSEGVMRLENVPLSCHGATIAIGIDNVATPNGTRPISTALLNVSALPTRPSIGVQPANVTITEGNRATLTVGYGGTVPITLSLQWLNGAQVDTGINTTSSSCPSPCNIQTPVLDVGDNGASFRVVLSNAQGDLATNPVTVTVNISRVPQFTQQPAAVTINAAQSATFNFAVGNDSGSFSYQWLVNGQPLANGSSVAGNGALQGATVSGATGSGRSGTLTLANVPLAGNGAALSVRVTRNVGGQVTLATSNNAILSVNTGIPANALTATQIVAGYETSVVLRPDRTVWAWGSRHGNNGTYMGANIPAGQAAYRPVQMYPAALTNIYAIAGWGDSEYWAIKGIPGTPASRVLHWGRGVSGVDGRGTDGNGSIVGSVPQYRDNYAAPVEVLERVNGVPQPVDRVCAIAGGHARLLLLRAINDQNQTTDCAPGSAKSVWIVGSLTSIDDGKGVAIKMAGLPQSNTAGYSPPSVVYATQAQGVYGSPFLITLEDGRLFGLGSDNYDGMGFGQSMPGTGWRGGVTGPVQLRAEWGTVRTPRGGGWFNVFAIRQDGTVMTSGYFKNGNLGIGPQADDTNINGPVAVLSDTCSALPCADVLSAVTDLASTDLNNLVTLALRNGQIYTWGARSQALQGGGNDVVYFPRLLPNSGSGYSAISASNAHALAIGPGNVVYSWGSGLRGALGDGVDGSSRNAPAMVTVP